MKPFTTCFLSDLGDHIQGYLRTVDIYPSSLRLHARVLRPTIRHFGCPTIYYISTGPSTMFTGNDDWARCEPIYHHLAPHSVWEANSIFGLVHSSGCKTCCKYMSHVVAASHAPHDHSFDSAVKARDSLAKVRYLEGIREGRRIQKQSDDRHFYQCREQRDSEALALSLQREEEIDCLRKELAELRDRLSSTQVIPEVTSSSDTADSGSLEALDLPEPLHSCISAARRSDSAPELHPIFGAFGKDEGVEREAGVEEEKEEGEGEDEEEKEEILGDKAVSAAVTHATSLLVTSCPMASPCSTDSVLSEPRTPPPQVATEEAPYEIEDLKSLMAAAHRPENSCTLKQVKALCSKAHSTPRLERTASQLYLLEHWRSPPFPTLRVHPPDTHHIPEIFVDASHFGIGFIFGRQWLAWRLRDGWRSEKRDINWAEMVAVELGIRAMISAGHRSSVLRVRSDSDTVVRALSGGTSKTPELMFIMGKIFGLCKAYSIELAVDWVSTKFNPADGPSRGVYPPKDILFEQHPPVPKHLIRFISPVQ